MKLLTVEGHRSAARKQVRSVVEEGPVGNIEDESVLMKALRDRMDREGGGGKGAKGKGGGFQRQPRSPH